MSLGVCGLFVLIGLGLFGLVLYLLLWRRLVLVDAYVWVVIVGL